MDDKVMLEVYRDAAGNYRWTFYVNGNKKAVGTDPQPTWNAAYKDAMEILGKPWLVETDDVNLR